MSKKLSPLKELGWKAFIETHNCISMKAAWLEAKPLEFGGLTPPRSKGFAFPLPKLSSS
jgi:hypothetical protein